MTNSTFLKIAGLIAFTGLVFWTVTPKYTFNAQGYIRKNLYSGQVEKLSKDRLDRRIWLPLVTKKRPRAPIVSRPALKKWGYVAVSALFGSGQKISGGNPFDDILPGELKK